MNKSALIIVLTVCIVLNSCKKIDENKTEFTYSFINTTGKKILLDVYSSEADYNNNQNLNSQTAIEPGATQKISLIALKDYWLDWYSEDYTCNNWNNSSNFSTFFSFPAVKYNAPKIDDAISIVTSVFSDTARSIILSGNKSQSRWQTAQEYGNGGSTLIGVAPYMEFVFKKNFTCEWLQKDGSGNIILTQSVYTVNTSSNVMHISLMNSLQSNSIATINFNASSFSFPHTTRDTLLATFYNNGSGNKYYSVVRE